MCFNIDLNFIYGKSYSNLKDECVREIQIDIDNIDIDKILVITDDRYKKEIEIGIRTSNIIDSNLKVQVNTIKELCANTINNFGDRRIKILNEDEQFAILVNSIIREREQLKLYKNLTLDNTFLNSINNTIIKFKEEGVTPEILEQKVKSLNNQLTKDKLTDFIIIFKEYNESLKGKFIDSADKLSYATQILQENCKDYKHKIYLYKIDKLSEQDLSFIEALNINAGVTAFIVNDNIDREPSNLSGAFFKTDLFTTKLKNRLVKGNSINIKSKYIKSNFHSKELEHLENNLFNYPYTEFKDKPNDIFLTECSNIENEIESLISSIEKLRNNNIDFSSITIATSNMAQYERTICSTFNKYSIPYSISMSKNLAFNPVSRFIENLLELCNKKNTATFLRLIKTGYPALSLENIDILEKYFSRDGVTNIDKVDINEAVRLNFTQEDELKILLENLDKLFLTFESSTSFKEFYKTIFKFLEDIGFISNLKEEINKEINLNKESNSLQVWQSIIKRLDSYSNVFCDLTIDKEVFIFMILSSLSGLEIKVNIDKKGVKVIPLSNLEEGTENVFIIGANEGMLPPKTKTSTIFTDSDILELNSANILQGEDTISMVLDEQFNTYKLLTSAKNKLFVSYPLVGKDLATMKKSPLTSRLKQLFPKIDCNEALYTIKDLNRTSKNISNLNNFNLIKSIISQVQLLNDDGKVQIISKLESLKALEVYNSYITSTMNALNYNNKAECKDKYILQSLYYSDTLSVSKLEKYAKCPFAYFAEYGLKVKEDEPTTLKAKHIGIATHSIFEQFDIRLKKNNKSWDDIDEIYINQELDFIMNYLEKRNSLHIFNSSESAKYYKNKLKELAKTSILALTQHIGNSFFKCIGHEINFDDRGTYPPIQIKLPSGKRLKLRGQIDRLDEMETNNGKFIRIVDYKTGNTTLDLTEVYYGTQLQLLTYLDAIIGSGDENEYLPAGAFYFKADDPYVKATPNASNEYIVENKLKELRMKGLFTNNKDIVQCMDKGIYDGAYKTSLNIQARFKTDGSLTKSTPGISMDDLEILRKYTIENIKESAYKMLVEGDISIQPTKKKNIEACTYCQYKHICQFDETLSFNNFKQLIELTDDEVINIASKKVSGNNEQT